MLPKKYRLPAKEFQLLYKNGFRARGKYGMLISKQGTSQNPLFGFVVSKKIGNAVKRHRMTRLLRAISMEIIKELKIETKGVLFEYIAFEFCDNYASLKEELLNQTRRCLEEGE